MISMLCDLAATVLVMSIELIRSEVHAYLLGGWSLILAAPRVHTCVQCVKSRCKVVVIVPVLGQTT